MVNDDESFTYPLNHTRRVNNEKHNKGFDIYPNPVSGNDINNVIFISCGRMLKEEANIRQLTKLIGRLRINTQLTANNNNLH
jgi:hypothetical protein